MREVVTHREQMAILAVEDLEVHLIGKRLGPFGKRTPAPVQIGGGRVADRFDETGQLTSPASVRPRFGQGGKVGLQRFRPGVYVSQR